ncbi:MULTISPECIES: hypothetical protein [Microbacterium]|uniref:Uncharacterized protein n=2 Tax=Microbacterium maritypicum TaxID=33918 RepID=A0AAJ6APR3_MICMQ|nr:MULTISPECIES: hypothetical protein [Microbacterium]EYT60869.1 hypothetical protein D514_0104100 [Microbacterium sp. UCD-TDU]UTT52488.1 hypothetical protein NMQ05_15600 [Microbacterium liquefaciens]WEF20515.1 hypothetical protein PWF71_14660 [Microbacterium liquefaciens]
MTTSALVSRSARLPLVWISLVVTSAPIVSALAKGSFREPQNWPLLVSVVGATIGVLGLVIPWDLRRGRPRLRELLILTGAVLVSSIILLIDTAAYEPSMFTVAIALCCMVIFFGHPALGSTVGFALIAARAVAVIVVVPSPGLTYIIDLYPIALLSISLIWLRYARRLTLRERGFRARASLALQALQQRERAVAEMRMRNSIASSGAYSALERIVRTGVVTETLHTEIRSAEAALRDHIRCPALEHPQLTATIATARRAGVNVLLLNASTDVGEPDRVIGDDLAEAISDLVRQARSGQDVTIRLLARRDDEPIAVSIVRNQSGGEGGDTEGAPSSSGLGEPIVLDAGGRRRDLVVAPPVSPPTPEV